MSDNEETGSRSHYHFRISVRMRHPLMAPQEITDAIGIEPEHFWQAGEARRTPTRIPLDGIYEHTYWTADVSAGRYPQDLNEAIHQTLKGLISCRTFLHQIRAEGGAAELFVGWFFENQSGDVMTYECLSLAGDLKIDLSFDVYPPDQPQREYEVETRLKRK